jgi:hypothetical protein
MTRWRTVLQEARVVKRAVAARESDDRLTGLTAPLRSEHAVAYSCSAADGAP